MFDALGTPGCAIRLEGLGQRLGGATIPKQGSLDVAAGDVVALIGPSGCGRTTLLRLLAGLAAPADGTIRFADAVMACATTGRMVAPERKLSDFPIDLPGAATLSLILMALAASAFLLLLRIVARTDVQTVAGKPRRADPRPLGVWTLPVLATGGTRTISGGLAWSNFSMVHFEDILAGRAGAMAALRTSISLGLGAAFATANLGALTAYVAVRRRCAAARCADTMLPSATPGIVVAAGLILAWTQPWLPVTPYNTVWALLIGYCCLLLPYPIRYANAALRQVSPSLEDAARVSGAGPVTVFLRIVLPLIAPSLFAAALPVFAVAMREACGDDPARALARAQGRAFHLAAVRTGLGRPRHGDGERRHRRLNHHPRRRDHLGPPPPLERITPESGRLQGERCAGIQGRSTVRQAPNLRRQPN
jgi:ABC-type glycerol-3-phosphate transport system permease component